MKQLIVDGCCRHPRDGVRAGQLEAGDLLVGHNGGLTPVDSVRMTERHESVYNLRVAEDHTYFVGDADWGFSLWVHNAYSVKPVGDGTFAVVDAAGVTVRPGFASTEEAGVVAKELNGVLAEAPENAIPNATRLSEAEQATAGRLQAQTGRTLKESRHVGAEYVDEFGKTYDALGTPKASQFWSEQQFLRSIDSHLLKSTDFTVIDLTGFRESHITTVRNYVNGLPAASQTKIIRIGF